MGRALASAFATLSTQVHCQLLSAWPALVRLSSRRLSELFGMRLARAYACGIALSCAALTLLLPATSLVPFNEAIADALRSASWVVAGLSALSATRDHEQRDDADGISTLATLRGSTPKQRVAARALATALRIALGVCIPALAVLLVSALRVDGPALAQWLVRWAAFIVAYSLGLGATLAVLARTSERLLATQGQVLLLGLVLGPELLRWLAGVPLPSLPAACGSLIALAEAWGRVTA